jgi:uncharacterized SAM-binding protein YcdF (DUF218 family)
VADGIEGNGVSIVGTPSRYDRAANDAGNRIMGERNATAVRASAAAEPTRYAAIIVLANRMDTRGNPNAESRARADAAVDAYRNGEAPLIVACGWAYRKDSTMAIAEAIRRYVIAHHGVPPDAVIAESDSRDTVGEAVFSKRNHAVPRGWKRLLVCTSAYHVDRARQIFDIVYGPRYSIEFRGVPSPCGVRLRASELRSVEVFRSTFDGVAPGDDEAIFERLRQRHPYYNGSVYPRIRRRP